MRVQLELSVQERRNLEEIVSKTQDTLLAATSEREAHAREVLGAIVVSSDDTYPLLQASVLLGRNEELSKQLASLEALLASKDSVHSVLLTKGEVVATILV